MEEWKVVDESDIDEKESKEEFSGYEGHRGVKCGGIEGNDGAGCVRAIVNENQSDVNGVDARSDNDSYNDISVMPVNEVFVGCLESDEYFTTAELDDLNKWEHFEVYDEVKDVGQKYLIGRWVCTEKIIDEGRIPKVRFVVRGFQEKTNIQSDSPTGSKERIRIVLMIVATNGWIDVTSAFLQGKQINRVIYLKPPSEAHTDNKLWQLKKCVHGLNDAARMWYFSVWEKLEELGCVRSSVDCGVFMWYERKELAGLIEIHVDDFL